MRPLVRSIKMERREVKGKKHRGRGGEGHEEKVCLQSGNDQKGLKQKMT